MPENTPPAVSLAYIVKFNGRTREKIRTLAEKSQGPVSLGMIHPWPHVSTALYDGARAWMGEHVLAFTADYVIPGGPDEELDEMVAERIHTVAFGPPNQALDNFQLACIQNRVSELGGRLLMWVEGEPLPEPEPVPDHSNDGGAYPREEDGLEYDPEALGRPEWSTSA